MERLGLLDCLPSQSGLLAELAVASEYRPNSAGKITIDEVARRIVAETHDVHVLLQVPDECLTSRGMASAWFYCLTCLDSYLESRVKPP